MEERAESSSVQHPARVLLSLDKYILFKFKQDSFDLSSRNWHRERVQQGGDEIIQLEMNSDKSQDKDYNPDNVFAVIEVRETVFNISIFSLSKSLNASLSNLMLRVASTGSGRAASRLWPRI